MSTTALVAISLAAYAATSPLSTPHEAPCSRGRASFDVVPMAADAVHPHGSIENSYIVTLRSDLHPQLMDNHINFVKGSHDESPAWNEFGSGLKHVYDRHSYKGYAGVFSDHVLDQIRRNPDVEAVETDQIVRTQNITLQTGAPWGLSRISHRDRVRLGNFGRYEYDEIDGEGVDVYVVDTGINIKHVEFEGRAKWGHTVPKNDVDEDGNGHGSHCAGTIGSKKYGVAKKANLYAVKVLGSNGSGSMSDVVAGVVWAAEAALAKAKAAAQEVITTGTTAHKGSIGSMSLGGGKSPALDRVVNGAVDDGLHFAVAAGNDNKDACDYSPAAAEKAVTVGASDIRDARADFSNFGKCVDIFGPGVNILSTYKGSPYATASLSGTSMATPHVAGLLAYLLSIYPSKSFSDLVGDIADATSPASTSLSVYEMVYDSMPSWLVSYLPSPKLFGSAQAVMTNSAPVPVLSPATMKKALVALSTKDKLSNMPKDTVNKLIFNNATA